MWWMWGSFNDISRPSGTSASSFVPANGCTPLKEEFRTWTATSFDGPTRLMATVSYYLVMRNPSIDRCILRRYFLSEPIGRLVPLKVVQMYPSMDGYDR